MPGDTLAVEEWRAEWIGMQEPAGTNAWLCFRKQAELPSVPLTARARITCDRKQFLFESQEKAESK